MPPSLTADGKEHGLFSELSAPFNRVGIHTLALGKPGVEFFTEWSNSKWFYDMSLYQGLRWTDLIDNLAEAVKYVQNLSNVDSTSIYVLGHSEGTQVAVDFAAKDPSPAGLILLGYAGEDMATTIEWQLFKRAIEHFIATDVDTNHDGYVTKEEASPWPEVSWNWESGENRISYQDIEAAQRKNPQLNSDLEKRKNSPLFSRGIYTRGPLYQKTASLKSDIYAYTGALDMQTRPREALELSNACQQTNHPHCVVTIIPGLGHGFSPPKKPRAHPLLDMTLGPIDESFEELLFQLAKKLKSKTE